MLKNYAKKYTRIWEVSSPECPVFSKLYSSTEKQLKEQHMDRFVQSVNAFRKGRNRIKELSAADEYLFFENTRNFFSDALDFEDREIEMMFSDEMVDATRAFVNQARSFDPALSFGDIFQALRNSWIMFGLQLIMGIPIRLTPSVFAYSMLYPYTDNLIDDPQISGLEKILFSERFRERLSGEPILPVNTTEEIIYKLVEMIEKEFPRNDFQEVFESLLDIHDAQTASLRLMEPSDSVSEQEAMEVCMNKGGASVLADGFLVAGKLTEAQMYFLYGYGAYLQMLDDIQDVDDDNQSGVKTIFSRDAFVLPLDQKVNKTFWFGEHVMQSLDFLGGQHIELFKTLIRRSMHLFVAEAIAQNPDIYSEAYVSAFEKYSLFHFDYIRKLNARFSSYHGLLVTAAKEIALTDRIGVSME